MNMFAIINTGGKQYKVAEGTKVKVEKLEVEEGKNVTFSEILLLADEDGKTVKIGNPIIKGAKVEAKVLRQARDRKVLVHKYKHKTRYRRVNGHRQFFTEVEVIKVTA